MKSHPRFRQTLTVFSVLLALASLNLSAAATDYNWIGGTGIWDTSGLDWNNGSSTAWPSSGTTNHAIFGGTAGTVTVDNSFGTVAVNQMTFNTANYNIGAYTNLPPVESLTLNGAPVIRTNADVDIHTNLISTNGFTWHAASTGILALRGNNSGLQGTINVLGQNQLNLKNPLAGSKNATWNIESSILSYNTTQAPIPGDGTIELGALSGNSAAVLRTAGSIGGALGTWVIGALNTNTTFAGHITDATFENTAKTLITKTGTGSLTLSGASTNTGVTTISQGTLIVGSDAVATTIAKAAVTSVDVSTNTLTYTNTLADGDRTLFTSHTLGSLPGGLLVNTTYYVINRTPTTFQVSETLGGPAIDLTSTGNQVLVSEAGALGSTDSFIVVGDAQTGATSISLLINGAHTIERVISVNNFGTSTTLGGNSDHQSTFSGAITLNKTANLQSVTTGANAVTFSGVLSGAGGIVKTGTGTVSLNNANTFTGLTTVTEGTLAYGVSNALSTGDVTVNGGTLALGTFSDSVGAVTLTSGSITSSTGTLTGTSYAVQSGSVSAILAGSGAVTKSTGGTATFSAVNTYTGATLVSAGTLIVSGTGSINSSSSVTVNGGTLRYNSSANLTAPLIFTSGTLAGTNFAGKTLSIGTNQTISPGNSTGTLVSASQTWAGGGTYAWEINDATGTAGAAGWDLLNITGDLTITANSGSQFNINVISLAAQVAGSAANFDSLVNGAWLIADATNAISTFDAGAFNVNLTQFQNAYNGVWSVALGGSGSFGGDNSQIYLTYSAIPEPSTTLLLTGALMALVLFRRRAVAR